MKRIITLCVGLVTALALQAQSDFPLQFADANGNIIPDGTTLNLSDAEVDDFGIAQVHSHVFVKNTGTTDVQAGTAYTIQSISNGALQSCFPTNCFQETKPGSYQSPTGNIGVGELRDMQTEWLPDAAGTAKVTFQLLTYKQNVITKQWNKEKEGPTITLNFSYGQQDAVSQATTGKNILSVTYCDLQGRPVAQPQRGLYVRTTTFADGTREVKKLRK